MKKGGNVSHLRGTIIFLITVTIIITNIRVPGMAVQAMTAQAVTARAAEDIDETGTIYIYSAKDLVSLAKKCSLDSWSRGKTVVLMNDIDLSGSEFTCIPTFGGVFDGQGYTIRGLSLTGYGSPQGLFLYVQEGSLIKKLTVEGTVAPMGAKSMVGGLAGNNSGTIQNCSFNGVVKGQKYVGGIAGINQAGGLISNCFAQGVVYGEQCVGGIAGENLGTILLCTNKANVNTTVEESGLDLEDLGNMNLENLTSLSTADIVTIIDIGGIAGFSTGIIQSCINTGTVGYQSVGYNVGGIAGRQSGHVSGCENNGIILGRKDVGGIAGQIEPYAFWEYPEDSLNKIRRELDILQSLINTTIDNTGWHSSTINTQLSVIGEYVEDARAAADALANQTISLVNDTIENINAISARVTQVVAVMEPIIGSFSLALDDMEMAIGKFKTAMEQMKLAAKGAEFGIYELSPALDELDAALDETREALENVSSALASLKAGLGDPEAMKDALSTMQRGISSLVAGMSKIADGLGGLNDAFDTLHDSETWKENASIIRNGISELLDGMSKMSDALQDISEALINLQDDFDEEKLLAALASLESALENLAEGTEKLSSGISKIASGLQKIFDAYNNYSVNDDDNGDANGDDNSGTNDGDNDDTNGDDNGGTNGDDNGNDEEPGEEWYREISEGLQEVASSMENIQRAINDFQDMLRYLREVNIDPEQTRKDFEVLMQGFADLAIATGEVIDTLNRINAALVSLLQSDEIKAFGAELEKNLQEIIDGVIQATRAMERVNSAMKKLSEEIDIDKLSESIDYIKVSIDDLISAISIIQEIKVHVEDARPYFEIAWDYASQAVTSAIEAITLMESSAAAMADAASQIHGLISELAAMPAITFKKAGSEYMETKDELFQSLRKTVDALSGLNAIISEISPAWLADIKSVSNQVFVMFDLLANAAENVLEADTGIESHREDISTQDTDSDTLGKVAGSTNYGKVRGDINVGGIAGSMAIEFEYDLEDEYNLIQKMSPDSKYLLRAVISGCENYGSIISKKNCAGGIVGLMDFGYVKGSVDNGSVASTGGDYVGGIAGKSSGTIQKCYAKSFLSGLDFVGGIAGYATNLYNCYSLISVENAREFIGAIAGDGDGLWEGNYFVHEELAGVNRISYSGKAEPITYEELLDVDGLPGIFKSFKLAFIADDKEVAVISFNYGDSIPASQIPPVPGKEGYFGKWERDDYNNLKFDVIVRAVYKQYVTTLASKETRENGLSIILVNGLFDEDVLLTIAGGERQAGEKETSGKETGEKEIGEKETGEKETGEKEPAGKEPGKRGSEEKEPGAEDLIEGKKVIEKWTISVKDDGQANRMVHYLPPAQTTTGINIYILQDGAWRKVKHTMKGKYLVFEIEGHSATFAVTYSKEYPVMTIVIIMAIAAVIAAFIWLQIGKGRRKPVTVHS
ncbi:MAG: hypothetical protein GX754_03170 [Clostridiaceae bacterium]|nr:hypothetical protein [Clostridiaceae bacterium]